MEHQPKNHNVAPFEKRLLALPPHELEQRILDRQKALMSSPGNNGRKGIEGEIGSLERRLSLLHEDMQVPTLDDVRKRQIAIGQEFARLDRIKNQDWLVRESLRVRLQILDQRRIELTGSSAPTIRILECRTWKKKDEWGGEALPPNEWGQLSPRLKANPQANLNENEEYGWYLNTLSDQKRKEVDSLAAQMRPIDDNVRAVVCIPTYMEGGNIYRTLSNYVGQVGLSLKGETGRKPFDYRKLRIVVFDNYPEGSSPDQTQAEVGRFIADHPEVPVDFIKATFNQTAMTIANIRNVLTSAVIESSIGRKNPDGELIYISNDGDMPKNAIKPTYVADIINEFDKHSNMDALVGKIDMPEHQMAQTPTQLAIRRLIQYIVQIKYYTNPSSIFLVGRNSALRLKMVAAVGNYDPKDKSGEDVEIGNKIKWVRSWTGKEFDLSKVSKVGSNASYPHNRIRYAHHISVETDPRRDLVRLMSGESIFGQYWNFSRQKGVRGTNGENLLEKTDQQGLNVFDRKRFEQEVSLLYKVVKSDRIKEFTTAMRFLGVKWTVSKGEFRITDTRRLEASIWALQFRELHQARVEEWLGTKLRLINSIVTGENNKVLACETINGRQLIIRTSSQKDRNKFVSEKKIADMLPKLGVPVPNIIAVDSTRTIIPGMVISVCERMPGQSLARDYTENNVVDYTLLQNIGNMLRKIHSIEVSKGYGYIDEKGNGSDNSWGEFVLRPFYSKRLKFLLDNRLINESDLKKAIGFVTSKKALLANVPRRLLHGDFTLGNILQQDNKLTGMLDFENAKAGDPLWDIALFAVYERARIGGDKGMQALLTGYGNSSLLTNPETRSRYYLYKLSNILYGLVWYSYHPYKQQDIEWLNNELKYTLQRLQSPTVIYDNNSESNNKLRPVSQIEIDSLLQARFAKAVDWFKNFYNKGVPSDQEFLTGAKRYSELSPVIEGALRRQDQGAKNNLFHALKKDPQIASSGFSDQELRRQIDRLVSAYRSNPIPFGTVDKQNPAYRAIVYLRNRGKLQRYEAEYANLPKGINFRQIALGLARKKAEANKTMNILDEGGTFDVALQQLSGAIKYHVPGVKVKLASIAADNMALEFADCHKYPVDHRMADVHRLNEVFEGEKRTLIVSQAAYKFFWDPVGAIAQTADALENGGWAFLGDIRDKTSYRIFEMFRDQNGKPIHPQKVFTHLNTLKLGYKFYTGMHTSTRDGEPRQVMTLAIKKESNNDLVLPISYRRSEAKGEWQSPLTYVLNRNLN